MTPARCELISLPCYQAKSLVKQADNVRIWAELALVGPPGVYSSRTPFGSWLWISKKDANALLGMAADAGNAYTRGKFDIATKTLYLAAPAIDA